MHMKSTGSKILAGAGVYIVALLFVVASPRAQSGGILLNGTNTSPAIVPGFLFEPEFPLSSLKTVPIWDELEQLLDNPYRQTLCTDGTPGTTKVTGSPTAVVYPAYCSSSALTRRPGFGITLPPLLLHPLNYNPTTGEEMRMLNPGFPGAPWQVPDELVQDGPNHWTWTYRRVQVTPGSERVEEPSIDNNGPIAPDINPNNPATFKCIENLEAVPPEGDIICGGDPGEPNYSGFGWLNPSGYSTPAVPNGRILIVDTNRDLIPDQRVAASVLGLTLFDPTRGTITPRTNAGNGGLRKPSVRVQPWGNLTSPGYDALGNNVTPIDDSNTIVPSNENDYLLNLENGQNVLRRSRARAAQLGKALFWDMQLGSDGVQSCGTCHPKAGADNRTKNQLNPNHIGGDLTFQVRQPNENLTASDFPLHKLQDPDVAGDPRCTPAIAATVNPGVLENNPGGVSGRIVCNAANIVSTANDVVSSMGVKFGKFRDIALGLIANSSGVGVVRPDLRSLNPGENVDPIPGFRGTDGHQIRRVEPRNTPVMFSAALNFDNFWDGRARHDFNGGSVFGAADPQGHVWVPEGFGVGAWTNAMVLLGTRQIIRFASIASLATGPALSEFEMSFLGRSWPKIGKKLLQGTLRPSATSVTPLANQLVDPTDSVLGPLSNQGGSECSTIAWETGVARPTAVGKPGLCVTYQEMIQRAFHPRLWINRGAHLRGHAAVCASPSVNGEPGPPADGTQTGCDPFDGYQLEMVSGPASPTNTNQFTQMEANMALFMGLATDLWITVLLPDNTPFDQFMDRNPDIFESIGEVGEPGLVNPMPICTSDTQRHCFLEVGRFKRDSTLNCDNLSAGGEGSTTPLSVHPCAGTRSAGQPDPLLGMDLFQGSNISLKNPNFRAARCGECHAGGTFTDHTVPFTFKGQLGDFIGEFLDAGNEALIEPLGRTRVISGFLLESEFNENGQDAIERRIINQSLVPNPVDGLAYPDGIFNPAGPDGIRGTADDYTGAGQSFFDNGVYNLGVTPCPANQSEVIGYCDDMGRGENDAFGWPKSLAALLLKNLGGPDQEPGLPLRTFNPSADPDCAPECGGGGLFEETAQDQQINPGEEGNPVNPLLPPYLAPWANQINVGDSMPDMDEVAGGLNTLTDVAMLEGFIDTLGPFNPAGVLNESMNNGQGPFEGTWPIVNRVARFGSFKAPQLRGVELTGPYFHNGGKLTLRQVVDFYSRGGDFPLTNAEHRDFNIVNLNIEVQSNLTEEEKVALVDFLLELTDERVRFARGPFDHPEVFPPLDGTAPENNFGRPGFLPLATTNQNTNAMFLHVKATGNAGKPTTFKPSDPTNTGPEPAFMGLSNARLVGAAATCGVAFSQYCR
jgi:cytochrome c peroxidase